MYYLNLQMKYVCTFDISLMSVIWDNMKQAHTTTTTTTKNEEKHTNISNELQNNSQILLAIDEYGQIRKKIHT